MHRIEQRAEQPTRLVELSVTQRLALTHQGQQHVLEAVQLTRASKSDGYRTRLAAFLHGTHLGFPIELLLFNLIVVSG